MPDRTPTALTAALLVALLAGCASDPAPPAFDARPAEHGDLRARIVKTAKAQIGSPYRYGGREPGGFDCSGLVVYSYRAAGISDLPHSADSLANMSEPISLDHLRPGDLLFFHLGSRKPQHVGIYVGGREFVHAPSSGKHVEKVSFDHVYWNEQLEYAGRLLR